MKRRHIAVFTMSGNGHVYPLLPLCSELIRRGFRVTFPTTEHYSWNVNTTGAEPLIYKSTPASKDFEEYTRALSTLPVSDPRWFSFPQAAWSYLEDSTTDLLSQVRRFYEENVPDLVLFNPYLYAARILAQFLDVPTVQISPHFAHYRKLWIRQNGICRNPQTIPEHAERLDSFLSRHGITSTSNLWHTDALNIHLIPETLQYHREFFDHRFLFAGRSLDRPFRPAWINNSKGSPVVLIAGYSGLIDTKQIAESHFKVLIDALADSELHCILSIGDNTADESLPHLPENFEVNRRASHLEILPNSALLICHGGMGTCLDAICNGVPVLTIPSSPYTDEIGYRVAELGLGVHIPKERLTIDKARDVVGRVIADTSLRDRVKQMQHEFTGSVGVDVAADRIVEFLDTR